VAYFQSGDNEKAMEAFRKVTQLEPDNANAYRNIGVVYYREGKWSESVPAFQKALELQPASGVYSNLGVVYLYQGNYAEAIKMFEKAVAMEPNEQLWVGNLADAYRYSGQKDKALSAYDRAIALAYKTFQVNPRNANVLGSLALYYAKKEDPKRALEFIRRARSIDANDNSLIYKQATINALAGKQAEALSGLREAFQKGYAPEEAKNDPELKALSANPEFGKLMTEFGRRTN
jgi:tetratricopeptide (TPR) repeat protein